MTTETSDQAKPRLWLKIGGLASLALGLGLGLLTLASAAGIWLGFWDFRRGFSLLGAANQYGQLLAWACLLLTAATLIAGQLFKIQNARKFVSLAAIGALVAWVAYLIPESFRPGEGVNYPPIHDISTNRVNPPEFVAIAQLRADAPNTLVYGGSNNMTRERLIELTDEAYPDLVTQRYNESVNVIFEKTLAAVDDLGWELVAQDASAGRIEATDTTFWFRFKDDVVIKIDQQGSDTTVDVRSVSRVGTGDVGANAIRMRKLFALLAN
ncbi:MAG: hypothetical protein COB20_00110 [SAR86 cluster bacterium]|uniref:DUF1499 domain-containing protein n=1 Tax=SAR86 cluster bacterium TaxID=2030880 RepID=A0A2A4XIC5_9GAMM|nr:MAG: hypothetical protein COB20_00110 [SAR86 cluster bacterium]